MRLLHTPGCRLLLKCLLYGSTTALPLFVGKLVPLDWYAFRCWELLVDQRPRASSGGPFYPNAHVTMIERGDLGVHTALTIRRPAEWQTDAYGWRNRPMSEPPDIVLVGDSNVAGASLSQQDTLVEALARATGLRVYAYSPADMSAFLAEERFTASPPATVVLINVERSVYSLEAPRPSPERSSRQLAGVLTRAYEGLMPTAWAIAVDRIQKKPWLTRYAIRIARDALFAPLLRAAMRRPRLWRVLDAVFPFTANLSERIMFTEDALRWAHAYRNGDQEAIIQGVVQVIVAYRRAVEARGMRFVFMPIPDKERIYWDLIPPQETDAADPPDFLPRLISRLRAAGIEVVDLQATFQGARAAGGRPYHLDDTHWNATGTTLAADRLAEVMRPTAISATGRSASR